MKKALIYCVRKCGASGIKKGILHFVTAFLFLMPWGGININSVHAQSDIQNTISDVSIAEGDEWYFFAGAITPPRAWHSSDFDVSSWKKGQSGFGYGSGANRTYLADMQGNYSTVYARQEFDINDIQKVAGIRLSVVCDGPFIAYLNGIEVIRTNTVQIEAYSQPGSPPQAEPLDISGFAHELFPYENVIAVECSNDDINSLGFSFIPLFEVLVNQEVR